MKIRIGFVTNSSSSSVIVLLPRGTTVESLLLEITEDSITKYVKEYYEEGNDEDFNIDKFKDWITAALSSLFANKVLWDEESYYESRAIAELLNDYVIGCFEGGPDEGKTVLVDIEKVEKIMGGEK